MRPALPRVLHVWPPALALALATAACERGGGGHGEARTPAVSPIAEPAVLDAFPGLEAIPVKVTAMGFEPSEIPAKKGDRIALAFTRTEERTCATEAIFDDLGGLEAKLPLNETVRVSFVVPKSGNLWFGCSMQRMVRGKIVASED